MVLLRRLLIVLFGSFLFVSISHAATDAVVFIHGTSDHREDALGGYWKSDFIEKIAAGLSKPENTLVIACDFRQYMWDNDAAGCVARQIAAFIAERGAQDITVITHSNGANVMRFILSNPSFDEQYQSITPFIKRVLAISPSSGGTPLADEAIDGSVFEESVGWLLGYRSNSVRQQRTGDMAIYNASLLFGTAGRPSLAIPFEVVVSSDVSASPISRSSYCNGFWLNAGLKLTKLYLDSCADGFLECSSQTKAGSIWFKDIEKTQNALTLSHNQSRHDCFGMADILIEKIRA